MSELNNLLTRYWEALNDEIKAIEESPSWSGKKDNVRFLACEIRVARIFIEAIEGKYELLTAHVERAEERSQQMIEFTGKMNHGR